MYLGDLLIAVLLVAVLLIAILVAVLLFVLLLLLGRADGEDVGGPDLAQLGNDVDGVGEPDHRQLRVLHVHGEGVDTCSN